jgi:transcriptional regulator with XRE-family HTH domain
VGGLRIIHILQKAKNMYITKEQLAERLNKTEVFIKERERKIRGSVSNGNPEKRLEHEDRVIAGILGEVDTQKNIAELLGVSAQTISNNSRGLTSPTIGVDKELKNDVEEGIQKIGKQKLENNKKIEEQLITNLSVALGHVANNLDNTDASEASKIAVDMSKILDRVSSSGRDERGNRTAIIINVPVMKEEKHYSSITV